MKKILTILIATCLFVSCKKKDNPGDFDVQFKFKNQTEQVFDILYLHSYRKEPQASVYDTILLEVSNIKIGLSSEYNLSYVPNKIDFTIFIDSIYYTNEWECTDARISLSYPQYRELVPGGDYLFTISNLDTINRTFKLDVD